jgi:hypothetical protein
MWCLHKAGGAPLPPFLSVHCCSGAGIGCSHEHCGWRRGRCGDGVGAAAQTVVLAEAMQSSWPLHNTRKLLWQRCIGQFAFACTEREAHAGLGMTLGMEWLQVPGTTGSYDSLFHLKAEAICRAVTTGGYHFGFVHVKAVDDTGHDRLWQLRVRYLERMDLLVSQIIRRLHEAELVRSRHKVLTLGGYRPPTFWLSSPKIILKTQGLLG